MKTSVAMCTYNGSRYLREQLESIALQTHLPDELIVCDDGSTDETIALITEFSRNAAFPVRLYCNSEKLGPAKNFEKAIGICTGDIIFLSDQDDVWKPAKVQKLLEVFDQHPNAAYAFSDAEFIDENGKCLNQTLWGALKFQPRDFAGTGQLRILLKRNVVTGAGMAFRAALKESVLPIPTGWMHDYWIGLCGSVVSNGIGIAESLFLYRRHTEQACGWRKKTFLQACKTSLTSGEAATSAKAKQFWTLRRRLTSKQPLTREAIERLGLLKEKERHLLKRAEARGSRGPARIAKVVREILNGRYARFSDSYCYSVIRDLIGT